MQSLYSPAKPVDSSYRIKAQDYQATLTKPKGSLGRLETIATCFSAYQTTIKPVIQQIDIVIMAADHGIANEGVSAFPQSVTAEMIKNFSRGGAAISVLSHQLSAGLHVYNVGTVEPLDDMNNVTDKRVAAGTQSFLASPAMTEEELNKALVVGIEAVDKLSNTDLFIGGEMGIANTSSAAAIAAKLLGKTAAEVVGRGTGIDDQKLMMKTDIIQQAIDYHDNNEPLAILRCVGGFEIAALVSAYIRCAQCGIPILLDGYIATAAALLAVNINATVKPYFLASHLSAEPGHKLMLESLELKPLLQLDMRLGEGSGAAIAAQIIRDACYLQTAMASFQHAGVSEEL